MSELKGISVFSNPKYQCLPKLNDKGSRRTKSSNLEEINSLLKFSQSVLSEEPTAVPQKSYAEAKDNSRYLYKPRGVLSRSGRPRVKRNYPVVGEVPRHPPCSLLGPIVIDPAAELAVRKPLSLSARRSDGRDTANARPIDKDHNRTSHPLHKNAFSSHPVQENANVSLLWEDRILDKLSGGTAWYVASKCAGPLERARVTRLVRDKYGSCDSLIPQASATRTIPDKVSPTDKLGVVTQSSDHEHDQRVQNLSTLDVQPQSDVNLDENTRSCMEPSYALQWDYVKELSRAMDGLQTYCGRLDTPTVVFGGEKVYRKQLQPYYPDQSSPGQYRRNDTIDSVSEEKRTTRGWKRWTALPNPVETHSEWLPVHEEVQVSRPSTTASSNFRELQQSREGRVKWRCGHELLNMFEEWRLKWGITDQFGDAGQDQVVQHLRHPADGVRLSALYHCARAAMTIFIAAGKSVKKEGQSVDKECEMFSTLRIFVPDLEKCLRDVNMCMRVGAAVLLTTLGQWSQQLEKLLLNTLPTPQVSEQWMALQCLAVQGVVRPEVVDCLLSHANQSQSPSRRDKARELLARLSKTTTLVYATVCEQLNSSGWQERLTACTVLPMLSGSVTKDVCDKLIVLMWQDWSSEVRHMAAEALGKLGRGKLIHDELCRRLAIEDERIRLDALRKVGALSLMTAQMLPAFLTCFQDPHISVRIEASSVAAEMGLSSKEVLDVLLFLTEDPSIKVKAHALRCLGVLGNSRSDIIDRLLWCMRFDRSETLRAEACEAVRILGVQSDRVVQELQMLVSHDDSELVVRLAKHALLSLGCQPKAYNKMETKIAEDIKNLTTLENVLHAC